MPHGMGTWGYFVPGEGPSPCPIMFVGEAPGREEDQQRRPFVGKSGQVLWDMVWRTMRLNQDDVFVTNLVKRRPMPNPDGSDNPPTDEDIQRDAKVLVEEIASVNPRLIVCLGKYSFRWLTGIDLPMETVHGKTYETRNPNRTVIPVFHPAAGIRNPDWLKYTWWDLQQADAELRSDDFLRKVRRAAGRQGATPRNYFEADARLLRRLLPSTCDRVAIDTEGTSASPYCLTFSIKPGEAVMIRATDTAALAVFREWLERVRPTVILHNALWDWPVLAALGIDLLTIGLPWRDTMEAAYTLQIEPKGLKAIGPRHFGIAMREYEEVTKPWTNERLWHWYAATLDTMAQAFEDHETLDWITPKGKRRAKPIVKNCQGPCCKLKAKVAKWLTTTDIDLLYRTVSDDELLLLTSFNPEPMPQLSLEHVPTQEAIDYACTDADVTLRADDVFQKKIRDMDLERVVDLDQRCWPMVDRMRQVGMVVDVPHLKTLGERLTHRVAEIDDAIRTETGLLALNPGSPDQMAEVFFRRQGMQSVKMTKSKKRESVGKDVIESLLKDYPDDPILPLYAERVTKSKLIGYTDKIPTMVEADGRIHPRLGTTSVVSGRYNDYLLTLPHRTEEGKEIRKGFVAPDGYVLGSWDLSQIELRVVAHLSGDSKFIEAFINGEDLHTKTAEMMFQTATPTKAQRYIAKTLNFAILYGISVEGLYAQFKIAKLPYTREDCERFISQWFAAYPGVKAYMAKTYSECRADGYVREERVGRLRYLPGIIFGMSGWPFEFLRSGAEREAFSMKVQGFARALLKEAAVVIWEEVLPRLWALGHDVQPVMDVHDELLFQVPDNGTAMATANAFILDAMQRAELRVPVVAEGKYGRSWGDLK